MSNENFIPCKLYFYKYVKKQNCMLSKLTSSFAMSYVLIGSTAVKNENINII